MPDWPNFFILGAPKAATTSLHRYLDEHPEVSMSEVKEPHFFSNTLDEVAGDEEAMRQAEREYKALFADADEIPVRGESSPAYLWRPEVPERIAQRIEEPRMLACLRDPIQRAYSDYLMGVRRDAIDGAFREQIERELDEGYRDEGVDPFVERGRYGSQLERYADTFGLERLHVVLLDELKEDPLGTLKSIARFLEIAPESMEQVDYETVHNPYGVPKNAFAKSIVNSEAVTRVARLLVPEPVRIYLGEHVLLDKPDKPTMDPEAKRLLQEVYEPEVRKAEELLGRELPELRASWDEPGGDEA